jgi:ankyrin repeat protein
VERLVDHDCDPTVVNNRGETALDLACRFGHLEVNNVVKCFSRNLENNVWKNHPKH